MNECVRVQSELDAIQQVWQNGTVARSAPATVKGSFLAAGHASEENSLPKLVCIELTQRAYL